MAHHVADAGGEGLLHPVWVLRVTYAAWAIAGVCIVIGALTSWEPSLALATLPDTLQAALGATLAAGGLSCLAGVGGWRLASLAWTIERSGLWLSAVAWAAYAVGAIALVGFTSLMSWGLGVTSVVICGVRYAILARRDRVTTRAVGESR